jgi:hypothetical protein
MGAARLLDGTNTIMAKKQKSTTARAENGLKNVSDYRFPEATRKNNPPAKIAAEGFVPLIPKAEYCIVRGARRNSRNNGRLMNPARTDGFVSRGYGSKMGKYICCESWWTKMRSRQ